MGIMTDLALPCMVAATKKKAGKEERNEKEHKKVIESEEERGKRYHGYKIIIYK